MFDKFHYDGQWCMTRIGCAVLLQVNRKIEWRLKLQLLKEVKMMPSTPYHSEITMDFIFCDFVPRLLRSILSFLWQCFRLTVSWCSSESDWRCLIANRCNSFSHTSSQDDLQYLLLSDFTIDIILHVYFLTQFMSSQKVSLENSLSHKATSKGLRLNLLCH